MNLYQLFRPLIFQLESEKAHNLAIGFLSYFPNLATLFALNKDYDNLKQNICGIEFANPIGMAAGFDKNCRCVKALNRFGFGFIEAGTVTPKPQYGNEKPRIFRLEEDLSLINRLGFNNDGCEKFAQNLQRLKQDNFENNINLGINIGKNKDTKKALDDYLLLLEKFYQSASYITLNISSPNTENLRNLQSEENLQYFLQEILQKKQELIKKTNKNTPIWLKIAPDIEIEQQEKIAEIILNNKIDALIISNTTISRPESLRSKKKNQQGGLSGKILFNKSNEILKNFYKLTNNKIPLIGVGGISSAEDIYQKIKFGASLTQIYSTLIYQGFGAVEKMKKELSDLVANDGFDNISEAVGVESV